VYVGKRGVSTSTGIRGAHVTVGRTGTRTTTTVADRPGTRGPEMTTAKRPFASCCKLPPMIHKYCCDDMRRQLEFRCSDHANLSDCPDSLVVLLENPARFGIRVHDGGSSCTAIGYCPWCGANLSAQLGVAHPR
jgi:hypothetical protein